jgi:hypothetical protein
MILIPGESLGPWPLKKTKECGCNLCSPIPGIFAKTRWPLKFNLTLAKVRFAELGFRGGIVVTL